MSESKLRTQSMDFAVSIIELVKELKAKRESIISNYIDQLQAQTSDSACASIRVMLIASIRTAKENTT